MSSVVLRRSAIPLWTFKRWILTEETISGLVLCQLISCQQWWGSSESGHSHDLLTRDTQTLNTPRRTQTSVWKKAPLSTPFFFFSSWPKAKAVHTLAASSSTKTSLLDSCSIVGEEKLPKKTNLNRKWHSKQNYLFSLCISLTNNSLYCYTVQGV